MKKRIVSVAPWQAGKTFAVTYFLLGLLIAVPLGLLIALIPDVPGQQKPGIGFFIAMPFIYAAAGLIFMPLLCWIYNKAARLVGGVEVTVATEADA